MFIIAGLGNPDGEYQKTRHNVGFDALDAIAKKYNVDITSRKHKALCGSCYIAGKRALLLKPQTYMNLSGESVREAIDYYKLDPSADLLVVYDDVSLDPGRIRVRAKGSAGGHNGIKSIIGMLGTQEFPRIKIGVGGPPPGMDLVAHVLGRFSNEDRALVDAAIADAADAAELIASGDIEGAMNRYNGKK